MQTLHSLVQFGRLLPVILVLGASTVIAAGDARAKAPGVLDVCADATTCYTNIQDAINAAESGDTIRIAAGTYPGSLTIAKRLKLIGASENGVIITRDSEIEPTIDSSGITVTADASVTIKSVTVTGFVSCRPSSVLPCLRPGDGSGIVNAGELDLHNVTVSSTFGHGISNSGALTLRRSTVSESRAIGPGGVVNSGTLTMYESTITRNGTALFDEGFGGGIANSGVAAIYGSAISNNSAAGRGGGIDNGGTIALYDTTVTGNFAGKFGGGGISNSGTAILSDSTVSGNTALFFGGGIHNRGVLTLRGTTVTANTAGASGGGIFNLGTVSLRDSVVTANVPDECDGC